MSEVGTVKAGRPLLNRWAVVGAVVVAFASAFAFFVPLEVGPCAEARAGIAQRIQAALDVFAQQESPQRYQEVRDADDKFAAGVQFTGCDAQRFTAACDIDLFRKASDVLGKCVGGTMTDATLQGTMEFAAHHLQVPASCIGMQTSLAPTMGRIEAARDRLKVTTFSTYMNCLLNPAAEGCSVCDNPLI